MVRLLTTVIVLGLCSWAAGSGEAPVAALAGHSPQTAPAGDHPTEISPIPTDISWAGKVVLGILVLFALAIPIGLFVRARTPRELPPEPGHDEHGSPHH